MGTRPFDASIGSGLSLAIAIVILWISPRN
jgi:hypothetical protein